MGCLPEICNLLIIPEKEEANFQLLIRILGGKYFFFFPNVF